MSGNIGYSQNYDYSSAAKFMYSKDDLESKKAGAYGNMQNFIEHHGGVFFKWTPQYQAKGLDAYIAPNGDAQIRGLDGRWRKESNINFNSLKKRLEAGSVGFPGESTSELTSIDSQRILSSNPSWGTNKEKVSKESEDGSSRTYQSTGDIYHSEQGLFYRVYQDSNGSQGIFPKEPILGDAGKFLQERNRTTINEDGTESVTHQWTENTYTDPKTGLTHRLFEKPNGKQIYFGSPSGSTNDYKQEIVDALHQVNANGTVSTIKSQVASDSQTNPAAFAKLETPFVRVADDVQGAIRNTDNAKENLGLYELNRKNANGVRTLMQIANLTGENNAEIKGDKAYIAAEYAPGANEITISMANHNGNEANLWDTAQITVSVDPETKELSARKTQAQEVKVSETDEALAQAQEHEITGFSPEQVSAIIAGLPSGTGEVFNQFVEANGIELAPELQTEAVETGLRDMDVSKPIKREAQRQAEEQAQRQAEEQAQIKAQKQAEEQAQIKAQKQAEEQAQIKAQEQAQRQAEEQAQKQTKTTDAGLIDKKGDTFKQGGALYSFRAVARSKNFEFVKQGNSYYMINKQNKSVTEIKLNGSSYSKVKADAETSKEVLSLI